MIAYRRGSLLIMSDNEDKDKASRLRNRCNDLVIIDRMRSGDVIIRDPFLFRSIHVDASNIITVFPILQTNHRKIYNKPLIYLIDIFNFRQKFIKISLARSGITK